VLARARVAELGISFVLAMPIACSFDSGSLGTGGANSVGEDDVGSTASNGDDPTGSDDDDASGDAASDDDGSTGSPACDVCAAAPPAEWSGPFAIGPVEPSDPNPACPAGWSREALGYRDLQAAAATCGCDCSPVAGQCNASASYCSDASCSLLVTMDSSTGECQSMGTLLAYGYVTASATAEGHGCTAVPSETIPPPSWGEAMMSCAPPPGLACDAGTCLPAVPDVLEDRWCVAKPGEQACPPGEYSEAIVVWQGVSDGRDCTACSCNVQGAATCAGVLQEYGDLGCFFERTELPLDGACHPAAAPGDVGWAVRYDGTPPSFACASSGSTPSGTATTADALTFCCAP
jgi:hypothetical protein